MLIKINEISFCSLPSPLDSRNYKDKNVHMSPEKNTYMYVLCVSAGNEPDPKLTLRANPTRLNLISDPEGPT